MKNQISRLEDLAAFVVKEAKRLGATASNVTIEAGDGVSIGVRLGEVDKLAGSDGRDLTFRAFVGQNSATTSTTDFRRASLTKMVRNTIALAKASVPDEFAGLPDAQFLAQLAGIPDLDLCDDSLSKVTVEKKIELALAAERAARAFDKRITNTQRSGFSAGTVIHVYANSHGFVGSYQKASCHLYVSCIAEENGQMEGGHWGSPARRLEDLETPDAIGAKAAERALRMLGAKKVKTQVVPVVYDKFMAGRLVGQLISAASGTAIYRGTSFLVDKLGEKIAADSITIVSDGHMKGAMGSKPFDDEGLPTARRTIIGAGKLETYLIDAYAARKLKTTPNGASAPNLHLVPGTATAEEIIASVKNGLYLNSVSGMGFNPTTGDYSMGASGIWIEDGKLAYPVSEITVASNILEMFAGIEAVGNDLDLNHSSSPTLKIKSMTVSGE
jgi:Predicted Zn-dependent proteases and their inactivated homologs